MKRIKTIDDHDTAERLYHYSARIGQLESIRVTIGNIRRADEMLIGLCEIIVPSVIALLSIILLTLSVLSSFPTVLEIFRSYLSTVSSTKICLVLILALTCIASIYGRYRWLSLNSFEYLDKQLLAYHPVNREHSKNFKKI